MRAWFAQRQVMGRTRVEPSDPWDTTRQGFAIEFEDWARVLDIAIPTLDVLTDRAAAEAYVWDRVERDHAVAVRYWSDADTRRWFIAGCYSTTW